LIEPVDPGVPQLRSRRRLRRLQRRAPHRLNPWAYLRDVLDQLAARTGDADV